MLASHASHAHAHGRARESKIVSRQQYLNRLHETRLQLHASGLLASTATASKASDHWRATNPMHAGYDTLTKESGMGFAVEQLAQVTSGTAPIQGMPRSTDPKLAASTKPRSIRDNFVNQVVEHCGPAVVRVEIEQKVEMPAMDNSDLFSFFFGIRPERQQQERRVRGHGSGFCVDGKKGLMLTNAHVVEGADKVTVSFAGRGAPMACEVLETDEVIDLAVLKLKEMPKAPLPEVELGSSETLKTGDWAIVLGNPFGLQNTCTLGIVSSLDRSTGETGFDWMRHPLLQTDAAVNQGNSGGPMLNEAGQVIGMISMRALFGEGIGFAIPIDSIKSALPSLMQRTKVPRSFIGLKMANSDTSSRFTSKDPNAVFIEMVLPNSPAAQAGLEVEDRILEVDGRKVKRFDEVQELVRRARVGTSMTFKIQHGTETRTAKLQTADIRQLKSNAEQPRKRGGGGGGPRQIIIMP